MLYHKALVGGLRDSSEARHTGLVMFHWTEVVGSTSYLDRVYGLLDGTRSLRGRHSDNRHQGHQDQDARPRPRHRVLNRAGAVAPARATNPLPTMRSHLILKLNVLAGSFLTVDVGCKSYNTSCREKPSSLSLSLSLALSL